MDLKRVKRQACITYAVRSFTITPSLHLHNHKSATSIIWLLLLFQLQLSFFHLR